MRTKQVVSGLNNSQKIRVIVDGVGLYMTVKDTDSAFATLHHREVVQSTLSVIAKEKIQGFAHRATHYGKDGARLVDCQVDLV